jgi:tRNA A37 threonylcarbamoyladenosine dehydratase
MQIGSEGLERLSASHVAVFGLGGVGGHCTEALARMGVGRLSLVDADVVCASNINRQIIALHSTLGRAKVKVMKEHILDIHPACLVRTYQMFYGADTAAEIDLSEFDYIVDAIDTVSAKLELICRAKALGVPIVSAMGAANKWDPTGFRVADIYETKVCPLAKVMRRELRKRGIEALKVVYSQEVPMPIVEEGEAARIDEQGVSVRQKEEMSIPDGSHKAEMETHQIAYAENTAKEESDDSITMKLQKRVTPASNAFVPPVAGLILAGEVLTDLCFPKM